MNREEHLIWKTVAVVGNACAKAEGHRSLCHFEQTHCQTEVGVRSGCNLSRNARAMAAHTSDRRNLAYDCILGPSPDAQRSVA